MSVLLLYCQFQKKKKKEMTFLQPMGIILLAFVQVDVTIKLSHNVFIIKPVVCLLNI